MPFGHVVGVLAQAQGLSALEQALMSAIVRRDAGGAA
jgi:predicted branched-subunit amino acid permease